jgi:hypothetical protein
MIPALSDSLTERDHRAVPSGSCPRIGRTSEGRDLDVTGADAARDTVASSLPQGPTNNVDKTPPTNTPSRPSRSPPRRKRILTITSLRPRQRKLRYLFARGRDPRRPRSKGHLPPNRRALPADVTPLCERRGRRALIPRSSCRSREGGCGDGVWRRPLLKHRVATGSVDVAASAPRRPSQARVVSRWCGGGQNASSGR